ncbi:MAG: LysR substrate-binding domain-containing protein [Pseudomonadota bacterium]
MQMTHPLPPLSRLRPFVAAARHESFSRAAEALGMTQAAVSKQVSALEEELGVSLFERRNRSVFLTEPGRRLANVVSAALSDIEAEIATIRGARRSNELVLHCQLCEAFFWLMPRMAAFHAMHPDVELRVVSTLAPLTETTEDFDVAIQTTGRASGSSRLAFTVSDEVFPVCAPTLVQGKDLPLRPTDLAAFTLLSHDVTPQDWMEWSDWFRHVDVSPPKAKRTASFDSYPLALQAAAAGQGIALGWKRTTDAMIAEGKLIRPCAEFVPRPSELSIFYGRGRQLHGGTERLLTWLSDEFAT